MDSILTAYHQNFCLSIDSYILFYLKVKKYKNESLINEFCFHSATNIIIATSNELRGEIFKGRFSKVCFLKSKSIVHKWFCKYEEQDEDLHRIPKILYRVQKISEIEEIRKRRNCILGTARGT